MKQKYWPVDTPLLEGPQQCCWIGTKGFITDSERQINPAPSFFDQSSNFLCNLAEIKFEKCVASTH